MKSKLRFESEDGLSFPAVTANEMREIDRIAVDQTGPSLLQMMENAGRSLAAGALERLGPEWKQSPILVLAGTGGNGGGGICAARHLANRGANVALCVADERQLLQAPAWQLRIYRFTRGRESNATSLQHERPHLIIDALLGYGLSSAPRDRYKMLIEWANASGAPILSLDVPSGLDASSGEAMGSHICPVATLTLALPKTGLRPEQVGDLTLADLGIPAETFRLAGISDVPSFGLLDRVRLNVFAQQAGD